MNHTQKRIKDSTGLKIVVCVVAVLAGLAQSAAATEFNIANDDIDYTDRTIFRTGQPGTSATYCRIRYDEFQCVVIDPAEGSELLRDIGSPTTFEWQPGQKFKVIGQSECGGGTRLKLSVSPLSGLPIDEIFGLADTEAGPLEFNVNNRGAHLRGSVILRTGQAPSSSSYCDTRYDEYRGVIINPFEARASVTDISVPAGFEWDPGQRFHVSSMVECGNDPTRLLLKVLPLNRGADNANNADILEFLTPDDGTDLTGRIIIRTGLSPRSANFCNTGLDLFETVAISPSAGSAIFKNIGAPDIVGWQPGQRFEVTAQGRCGGGAVSVLTVSPISGGLDGGFFALANAPADMLLKDDILIISGKAPAKITCSGIAYLEYQVVVIDSAGGLPFNVNVTLGDAVKACTKFEVQLDLGPSAGDPNRTDLLLYSED